MNQVFKPVPPKDPAGLDKVLLAAGEGCARYLEGLLRQKTGQSMNIWDGADGLGAILGERLKAAGVPNKRLPELVTVRAALATLQPCLQSPKRRVQRLQR